MIHIPNIGAGSTKNTLLMTAAIAAGLRAASIQEINPTIRVLLIFAATALAYFADPPRDVHSKDRATDMVDETAEQKMEGKE